MAKRKRTARKLRQDRPTPRTAWHPLLYLALRHSTHPDDFDIQSEVPLFREPQRADYVLIRRHEHLRHDILQFRSIFSRIKNIGLAELRGPTDDAEGDDLHDLMAHAWQLTRLLAIHAPSSLTLFVMANTLTESFRERTESYGCVFEQEEHGVWLVSGLPHVLYFIESGEAHEARGDELVYMFSRKFLEHPAAVEVHSPEEMNLFIYLCQQVEQLKRRDQTMALKDMSKLDQASQDALMDFVSRMPPQKILSKFLSPELDQASQDALTDFISRMPPQKILSKYPSEERLRGLGPEERLRGLGPEERLRGLGPEEIERLKRLLH